MGMPAIGNQVFRILSHARLHQAVEQWQEKYPGVDIVLIEPEADDELMFGTPIMDYSRRLRIARHGFESVTAMLARDYENFEEVANDTASRSPAAASNGWSSGSRKSRSRPRPGGGSRADDLGVAAAVGEAS